MPDTAREIIDGDSLVIQRNKIPDYRPENFGECIRLWKVWDDKKILPYSGGYLEQPADVVTMFSLFDEAIGKHRQAEHEKAIAESKRGR